MEGYSEWQEATGGGEDFMAAEDREEWRAAAVERDAVLCLVDCRAAMFAPLVASSGKANSSEVKQERGQQHKKGSPKKEEDASGNHSNNNKKKQASTATTTHFAHAMRAVLQLYQNKIICSDKDLLALALYNTEQRRSVFGFPGIYVVHPFGLLGTDSIQEAEQLVAAGVPGSAAYAAFRSEIGHADLPLAATGAHTVGGGGGGGSILSDALWAAQHMFNSLKGGNSASSGAPAAVSGRGGGVKYKRIFIFTNDDDPTRLSHPMSGGMGVSGRDASGGGMSGGGGNSLSLGVGGGGGGGHAAWGALEYERCASRVRDMHEAGIAIEVFGFSGVPPLPASSSFAHSPSLLSAPDTASAAAAAAGEEEGILTSGGHGNTASGSNNNNDMQGYLMQTGTLPLGNGAGGGMGGSDRNTNTNSSATAPIFSSMPAGGAVSLSTNNNTLMTGTGSLFDSARGTFGSGDGNQNNNNINNNNNSTSHRSVFRRDQFWGRLLTETQRNAFLSSSPSVSSSLSYNNNNNNNNNSTSGFGGSMNYSSINGSRYVGGVHIADIFGNGGGGDDTQHPSGQGEFNDNDGDYSNSSAVAGGGGGGGSTTTSATDVFADLLGAVRRKTYPQRPFLNVELRLGPWRPDGAAVPRAAVSVYTPLLAAPGPAVAWLDGADNKLLCRQSRLVRQPVMFSANSNNDDSNNNNENSGSNHNQTAAAVGSNNSNHDDLSDVVSLDEVRYVATVGGAPLAFTREERARLAEVAAAGEPPGLTVVCFKYLDDVVLHKHALRRCQFLHANLTKGGEASLRLFVCLVRSLRRQGKAAIAQFIQRQGAAPRLVALVPSPDPAAAAATAAELGPNNSAHAGKHSSYPPQKLLHPPPPPESLPAEGLGLYVFPLPYADDLRSVPDLASTTMIPGAAAKARGPVLKREAGEGEEAEAAADAAIATRIVKALTVPYDILAVPNPSLQKKYLTLQRLALRGLAGGQTHNDNSNSNNNNDWLRAGAARAGGDGGRNAENEEEESEEGEGNVGTKREGNDDDEEFEDLTLPDREGMARYARLFNEFNAAVLSRDYDADKLCPQPATRGGGAAASAVAGDSKGRGRGGGRGGGGASATTAAGRKRGATATTADAGDTNEAAGTTGTTTATKRVKKEKPSPKKQQQQQKRQRRGESDDSSGEEEEDDDENSNSKSNSKKSGGARGKTAAVKVKKEKQHKAAAGRRSDSETDDDGGAQDNGSDGEEEEDEDRRAIAVAEAAARNAAAGGLAHLTVPQLRAYLVAKGVEGGLSGKKKADLVALAERTYQASK